MLSGVEGKEELLKEAVESYSMAGRVGAALRLAQSYDMEAEVRRVLYGPGELCLPSAH